MLVKHRMDRKFVIFQELAAAVTGSAGKKGEQRRSDRGRGGEGRARGGGGGGGGTGTTVGLMGKREIAIFIYSDIYIYIYIYWKCGLINYYWPGPQQPRERHVPGT